MKSLREIESVIIKTDCKIYLRDGWSRSKPILTKDENGVLIDNYFMYASNFSRDRFSTPLAVFGIYSDEERVAYNTKIPKEDVKSITLDEPMKITESVLKARTRFEELYPIVRECAYSECTDEQKNVVNELTSCLETFSGPVVWKFYQELFPSFFEWAQNL